MRTYVNPPKDTWPEIVQRSQFDNSEIEPIVAEILSEVKSKGDAALRSYTQKFDKWDAQTLKAPEAVFDEAEKLLDKNLIEAIQLAAKNIEKFHRLQTEDFAKVETMPGVSCWRKSLPIEKVGLYVPGGTAPLFSSVLMLAIPARLAGCKEIVLCTPAPQGKIHPAMLYAAQLAGVTQVFKVGGAQAIAAMAFGTESIPAVYKIAGPGNQFVTKAKQMVTQSGVAIDMPAGPSEVLVIADDTARADFVAADMLSQAEHGNDSQAILITTSHRLVSEVKEALEKQLKELPRADFCRKSLENSKLVFVENLSRAMELSNFYAPEHLILAVDNPEDIANSVTNAGSVFLGHYSCESAGDYASGTNHTLPTNGYATAYSGVSLDSFIKKVTFQQLTVEGLKNLGPAIMCMAKAEELEAHSKAVEVRLNSL